MVTLDYLVLGHATRDLKNDSFTIGGTAAYAARAARALGCCVGVVTSADPDLDLSSVLEGVLVARHPASTTTTFENIYTDDGRHQVVHGVAELLVPAMVPPTWRPKIVHVGPVARECDPGLVSAFENVFIGVTPQGWMRQWREGGYVHRRPWEEASAILPHADAVVLSKEDVADERVAARYAAQTRLLALTQGPGGCTIYTGGRVRHFSVPKMEEVDPTGAGDIFAVPFFILLQRGYDPWTAARFANCIAARSVTRVGLEAAPTPEEVVHCKRALLGDETGYAHHLRPG